MFQKPVQVNADDLAKRECLEIPNLSATGDQAGELEWKFRQTLGSEKHFFWLIKAQLCCSRGEEEKRSQKQVGQQKKLCPASS